MANKSAIWSDVKLRKLILNFPGVPKLCSYKFSFDTLHSSIWLFVNSKVLFVKIEQIKKHTAIVLFTVFVFGEIYDVTHNIDNIE